MRDEINKRAREIFLELSTLDGSQPSDELDRLVGSDAALRAAVVSLLDARKDADHDGLMSSPTSSVTAGPIAEGAGSIIGPYKVLQLIGEGGFGSVFLAEQSRPVRRRVAIKIIKLGMDTRQVIARFEAERQALALMDHPHIARVFDAGATDSGRPYFAMEYVVGDAITRFADAYTLDIPQRLALFSQVCSAVQHAHTKGVIHRDLKPANVLVSRVDGKPFAKVIDFGIAKATASPLTDKTLFTEHRQLIGTPEYMSPEQADGSPDIDTRTDVYALGVLLYELLTGATPFDGTRLRSAAWAEMQRIIREEDPPVPSLRLSRDVETLAKTAAARRVEPLKLSASVRGELDWVVMKALDKDRGRRYETPAQLAEDIGRHLSGDAVQAAPPSRGYRVRKFIKRHRGPVIAGGSISVALLIGIAGTAWGWTNADRANRALTADRSQAEDAMLNILIATVEFDEQERANIMAIDGLNEAQAKRAQAEAYVAGMKAVMKAPPFGRDPLDPARLTETYMLTYIAQRQVRETVELKDQLEQQVLIATDALGKASGELGCDDCPLEEARLAYAEGYYDAWLQSNAAQPYLGGPESELRLRALAYYAEQNAQKLRDKTDAAEWSAYTANLALAQSAMDAGDWPGARGYLAACPESKRGWEWLWAHNKATTVIAAYRGWSKVSPDTESILVTNDGVASVYRLDGSPLGRSIPTNGQIVSSGFSADSKRIFLKSTDQDGVMHVTVASVDGTVLCEIVEHQSHDSRISINHNGGVVATASGDQVRLWHDDGSLKVGPLTQTADVEHLVFSPDGTLLLAVTADFQAQLWTMDGSPVGQTMRHDGKIYSATFSGDSRLILTTSADRTARLWTREGVGSGPPMVHDKDVYSAVFCTDGKHILTEASGSAAVWDISGAVLVQRYKHEPRVYHYGLPRAQISLDDSSILTWAPTHDRRSLRVSDRSGKTIGAIRSSEKLGGFESAVLSPVSRQLLALSGSRYQSRPHAQLQTWTEQGDLLGVSWIQRETGETEFNSSGSHVISRWYDGGVFDEIIEIRDLPLKSVESWILGGTPFQSDSFVISALGLAVELDEYGAEQLPLLNAFQSIEDYAIEALGMSANAMHPDGSRSAIATGNTIRFVIPDSEKEIAVVRMHTGITGLKFTPDGTRLVIALDDGTGLVLDTRSAEAQGEDTQQRWAEREPAGNYLDTLWASSTPTDSLRDTVIADPSLTPLRRLVAAEMLIEYVDQMNVDAKSAFREITENQTEKAAVIEAAEALELDPRTKAELLAKVESWEYTPKPPSKDEQLAEETRRRRIAEADAAIRSVDYDATGEQAGREREAVLGAVRTYREYRISLSPDVAEALHAALAAVDTRSIRYLWAEASWRAGEPYPALHYALEAPQHRMTVDSDSHDVTKMEFRYHILLKFPN